MRDRAGGDRLLAAFGVDLLAGALLHPHARAAGAAAHALGAVARHLDEVDAGERADDAPRREVHVVVAAEVAGVVVRDALLERRAREREPAVAHELVEQLAVVHRPRSCRRAAGSRSSITLKQCGHCVMIFFTPMPLNVSTFCIASIWKMYSLPERRAWSPLHSSLGPRIAKSMPGALQQLGERAARLLVAVVEAARAADEVEVLVVERRRRPRRCRRLRAASAQSPRSPWFRPYALPEFSIDRYVLPSSAGKSLSISVR